MDPKEATDEFVKLVKLGSAALQNVFGAEGPNLQAVVSELNEIRFLLDALEDASLRLQTKLQDDWKRSAG